MAPTQAPKGTQASRVNNPVTNAPKTNSVPNANKNAPAKTNTSAPAATSEEAPAKEKKEKIQRVAYMTVAPKEILNSEGKLIKIPNRENAGDNCYDETKHLKPQSEDFADDADRMEFQAETFEAEAEDRLARAKSLREQAESYRKFGDPEQRNKVLRAQKITDQLANLKEELRAQGVDLASLGLE